MYTSLSMFFSLQSCAEGRLTSFNPFSWSSANLCFYDTQQFWRAAFTKSIFCLFNGIVFSYLSSRRIFFIEDQEINIEMFGVKSDKYTGFVVLWKSIKVPLVVSFEHCKEILARVLGLLPHFTGAAWNCLLTKMFLLRFTGTYHMKFTFLEIKRGYITSFHICQPESEFPSSASRIVGVCLAGKQEQRKFTFHKHYWISNCFAVIADIGIWNKLFH